MFSEIFHKGKTGLILLILLGFFSGLFCTVNRPQETMAHSSASESITIVAQEIESCCGTSLVKTHHSLKEMFFLVSKNPSRDWMSVLLSVFVFTFFIAWRRFFEFFQQQHALFIRFYIRQTLDFFVFYLQAAFSQGILHPKKYRVVFFN